MAEELFQPDPTRQFPPLSNLLQCSEENHPNDDGENQGAILFSCSVDGGGTRLSFRCRDRSIGVMNRDEPVAVVSDDTSAVDPHFFNSNYDLYGKTGFQIWPGSRLMIEALLTTRSSSSSTGGEHRRTSPPVVDSCLSATIQEQIQKGARVLELGGGVGWVGIALAAAGAQALVTDLPTLVHNAIEPNILRNNNNNNVNGGAIIAVGSNSNSNNNNNEPKAGGAPAVVSSAWMAEAAAPVGRGWAGAAVLDLMKPFSDQLDSSMAAEIDLVVSSDVLCFRKLLHSTLDVLDAVFAASPRAEFIFTYQRRDKNEVFTTLEEVLLAIDIRGWSTPECLAWRKVYVGKNDEDGSADMNYLFLFRTTPKNDGDGEKNRQQYDD